MFCRTQILRTRIQRERERRTYIESGLTNDAYYYSKHAWDWTFACIASAWIWIWIWIHFFRMCVLLFFGFLSYMVFTIVQFRLYFIFTKSNHPYLQSASNIKFHDHYAKSTLQWFNAFRKFWDSYSNIFLLAFMHATKLPTRDAFQLPNPNRVVSCYYFSPTWLLVIDARLKHRP